MWQDPNDDPDVPPPGAREWLHPSEVARAMRTTEESVAAKPRYQPLAGNLLVTLGLIAIGAVAISLTRNLDQDAAIGNQTAALDGTQTIIALPQTEQVGSNQTVTQPASIIANAVDPDSLPLTTTTSKSSTTQLQTQPNPTLTSIMTVVEEVKPRTPDKAKTIPVGFYDGADQIAGAMLYENFAITSASALGLRSPGAEQAATTQLTDQSNQTSSQLSNKPSNQPSEKTTLSIPGHSATFTVPQQTSTDESLLNESRGLRFWNGQHWSPVTLLGVDELTDVAIFSIEAESTAPESADFAGSTIAQLTVVMIGQGPSAASSGGQSPETARGKVINASVRVAHSGGKKVWSIQTSVEFDPSMAGAPVYDSDGNLVGIVLNCDSYLTHVLPIAEVRQAIISTE